MKLNALYRLNLNVFSFVQFSMQMKPIIPHSNAGTKNIVALLAFVATVAVIGFTLALTITSQMERREISRYISMKNEELLHENAALMKAMRNEVGRSKMGGSKTRGLCQYLAARDNRRSHSITRNRISRICRNFRLSHITTSDDFVHSRSEVLL